MRLLIIYDRPNWAYHRRAEALQKYAPSEFDVMIATVAEFRRDRQKADMIFLLDYASLPSLRDSLAAVPIIVSFNADEKRRQDWFARIGTLADHVVCVSRRRFFQAPSDNHHTYLANGVDCEVFKAATPWSERPNRVLWCGSERQQELKGYNAVLRTLRTLLEFHRIECDLRLVGNDLWDAERMTRWYNSGRYILCASESEGTANTVLEGAACGCLPITTKVGQFGDWGCHGHNCLFVKREAGAYLKELQRPGKELRAMARRARRLVKRQWDYEHHAAAFFDLFRRVLSECEVTT